MHAYIYANFVLILTRKKQLLMVKLRELIRSFPSFLVLAKIIIDQTYLPELLVKKEI